MHGVFTALAKKYSSIHFYTVEAESCPDISEKFDVAVVPTFFGTNNRTTVGKVEGANPAELSKLVKQLVNENAQLSVETEEEFSTISLQDRLKQLVNQAPVMLFMKGSPTEPRCGFSRKIVELLSSNDISFSSFDILSDQEIREGLKTFSDWPTYPQLYVKAELVGGLDIVKEMAEGGDLKAQLGL